MTKQTVTRLAQSEQGSQNYNFSKEKENTCTSRKLKCKQTGATHNKHAVLGSDRFTLIDSSIKLVGRQALYQC